MVSAVRRYLEKRKAYRLTFLRGHEGGMDPSSEIVMADLAKFCRGNTTTIRRGLDGRIDPLAMAVAEGRREVFLRIAKQLNLSDAAVARLYEIEGRES